MASRSRTKTKRASVHALSRSSAPKVALDRSREAHRKIRAGIAALKRIQTEDEAIRVRARGWPTSVDAFRRWKHLGSDILYGTGSRYLETIKEEVAKLADLLDGKPPPAKGRKRSNELSRIKNELAECKSMLAARDLDILRMSKELEQERADKTYYMNRLEEISRQFGAPLVQARSKIGASSVQPFPTVRGPSSKE